MNVCPQLDDDKGASLVLLHTSSGEKIFHDISHVLETLQVDTLQATSYNTACTRSVKEPQTRSEFLSRIHEKNFVAVTGKYTRIPFIVKIKDYY